MAAGLLTLECNWLNVWGVATADCWLAKTDLSVNALIRHAHKLPQELYQSLTWDRGKELAAHKRFTLATDVQVYFCDPQHPPPVSD